MHNPLALTMLAGVVLLAPVTALAETVHYTGTLSPQSEVPPHPDLKGNGKVDATYDTASMKLTYSVTYDGLTGKAIMAHFHGPAETGKNAGVMVPVNGALTSPINGSATLTADQAKALRGGEMYFNIHTEANKGGELRAQVEKAM